MRARSFLKTVFTRSQKARVLNFKSFFAARRSAAKSGLHFGVVAGGARRTRAKGGAMLASVKFSAELRRRKDASILGFRKRCCRSVRWSLIG